LANTIKLKCDMQVLWSSPANYGVSAWLWLSICNWFSFLF